MMLLSFIFFFLAFQFTFVVCCNVAFGAFITTGLSQFSGASDARYIRVETCMFMVKLPQYSTQEKMTEKLIYAINCREDPLTDMM